MKKILASILALAFLLPSAGEAYKVPEQLLIVNKKINQLAFYEDGVLQKTAPVATGKYAKLTPEGKFKVIVKWKCPVYYRTNSKGCATGNPLGLRWLGLNVPGTSGYTYGIHGNNNESSIGTYASSGCVRMHNKDIVWMFDHVKVGANVVITNSTKSFEEIASANGFNVGYKTEKINETLTIYEKTYLYNHPNNFSRTKAAIKPTKIKAFEKFGSWYHINTWIGPKWVHESNAIVGIEEKYESVLELNEIHELYNYPNEKKRTYYKIGAQKVKTVAKVGNWYKIKTWVGEKWIEKDAD